MEEPDYYLLIFRSLMILFRPESSYIFIGKKFVLGFAEVLSTEIYLA